MLATSQYQFGQSTLNAQTASFDPSKMASLSQMRPSTTSTAQTIGKVASLPVKTSQASNASFDYTMLLIDHKNQQMSQQLAQQAPMAKETLNYLNHVALQLAKAQDRSTSQVTVITPSSAEGKALAQRVQDRSTSQVSVTLAGSAQASSSIETTGMEISLPVIEALAVKYGSTAV